MNNIPRWYHRIENFMICYKELDILLKTVKNNITSSRNKQLMLDFIKRLYVFYYKILRDLLKDKSIKLFYPREIFLCAEQNGIIKNATIWLEYIELLNILCFATNLDRQNKAADCILLTYVTVLQNVKNELLLLSSKFNNTYNNKHSKLNLPLNIDKNIVDSIEITNKSFNIFFKFLNSHTEIKYVWLYGSRAEKTARLHSDIDLLIDSPLKEFEQLKVSLGKIRTLYRFDIVNIHDPQNYSFISYVSNKSKLIYKASLPIPIE